MNRRILLASIACGLLSSCASLLPAPTLPATSTAAKPIDSIDISGRLSVRYQSGGKEEALHGSFSWAQRADHLLITLLSPLGQTLATIDVRPGVAVLAQSGQPDRTAADANALAQEALGWPLPVAGLRGWLQGDVTDGTGRQLQASPADTAPILTADGWLLRYVDWASSASANRQYPKRIDLNRRTAQAGDVAIRIAIDNFQPI